MCLTLPSILVLDTISPGNCKHRHLRCHVSFNTGMASHKQDAMRLSAGNKALRRGGDAIFAAQPMPRKLFDNFGQAWAQAHKAIELDNTRHAYRKESMFFHTAMDIPLYEALPSRVEHLFGKQTFV